MVPLPVVRPHGAPTCWGQKYQDGDVECGQCAYNDTCRKEVLRGAMNVPMPSQIPLPRAPAWPAPQQPQVPAFRPQPVPVQPIQHYQQPIPVQVTPTYQYQQPAPFHLPLDNPNPMQPWSRPGAVAPPYYFTQYPGETAVERIAKNLLLRAIAAIAQELVGFFIQWTWPPSRSNTKQD